MEEGKLLQFEGNPSFVLNKTINLITENKENESYFIKTNEDLKKQKIINNLITEKAFNWSINEGFFEEGNYSSILKKLINRKKDNNIKKFYENTSNILNNTINDKNTKQKSLEIFFTLFYEQAVINFNSSKIQLLNSGLPKEAEDVINNLGLYSISNSPDIGTRIFRHIFAQNYSAAILLIGTNYDNTTIEFLNNIYNYNSNNITLYDKNTIENNLISTSTGLLNIINFDLSKKSNDFVKNFVIEESSKEFLNWLNKQEFIEDIIYDMVPNFERRLIDLSLGTLKVNDKLNPLNKILSIENSINDKDKDYLSKISNSLKQMAKIGNKYILNEELKKIGDDFDNEREIILENGFKNFNIGANNLSSKLADRRKKDIDIKNNKNDINLI